MNITARTASEMMQYSHIMDWDGAILLGTSWLREVFGRMYNMELEQRGLVMEAQQRGIVLEAQKRGLELEIGQ